MRDVELLHPRLREKVEELQSICEKRGLLIGIGECVRTKEEQDALYAKGRTVPGKIVTKAQGSTYQSMHQWGVAFDFFRKDGRGAYFDEDGFFEKVGKIGKEIGLEWGGDWKTIKDKPHFQLPDWGSGSAMLRKKYKTPENFISTWEEAMTESERKRLECLEEEVKRLKLLEERVYHYTCELPEWARPTIQKLLDKGIFQGKCADDLGLSETMMRMLVINERSGIYDLKDI